MKSLALAALLVLSACGVAPPAANPTTPVTTPGGPSSADTITVTSSGITTTVSLGPELTFTTEFQDFEPHTTGPITVSPEELDDIKNQWAQLGSDPCATDPIVHEPWTDECPSTTALISTLTDLADDPWAFPGWLSLDYDPSFSNGSGPGPASAIPLEEIPMALPLTISSPTFETWERPYLMNEDQYGTYLWNLAAIASTSVEDTCYTDDTARFTITGKDGLVHDGTSQVCDEPPHEVGYSALTSHISSVIDDPSAVQPARWDIPNPIRIRSADVVTTIEFVNDRVEMSMAAPGRDPIELEPYWKPQRWINEFTDAWAGTEECETYTNEPWHETDCPVSPEAMEVLADGWPNELVTLPMELTITDDSEQKTTIAPPLVTIDGAEHTMDSEEITEVLWAAMVLTTTSTWDVRCEDSPTVWVHSAYHAPITDVPMCPGDGPIYEAIATIADSIERRTP